MTIKDARRSWERAAKSLWSSEPSAKGAHEDIRIVNTALLPILILGFGSVLAVGWHADAIGSILLWAAACLASGATIGFLFGIPRSSTSSGKQQGAKDVVEPNSLSSSDEQSVDRVRPNTNLEEVSDWLTKIIVGLSLVNLSEIKTHISLVGQMAAASLNATPTRMDVSAGIALVVGFPVIGFLCGYLYTRLFLQGAFIRSDKEMYGYGKVVASELSQRAPEPTPKSGEPAVPSPDDRQSAERILQVAPVDRPNEVLAPLRALAAEYESVRREMSFGSERTRKMSEIANGMRKLALATAPFLPQLTQSASPGERLAAVIILQMRFDPNYIEWLANRLVDEPAFGGYQAASALLARIRIVGGPEQQRIKKAVEAAVAKRAELGLEPEEQRDKLVQQILGV